MYLNYVLLCILMSEVIVMENKWVEANVNMQLLPNVSHSEQLRVGWVTSEKDQIVFCAASLRNVINTEDANGHIQTIAMVTMDTAVTSALPIELELKKYGKRGHDLVADRQLIIAHNQFNTRSWRKLGKVLLTSTYVTKVLFYPQRSKRPTVDNPAHTRDDLAIIRFHTITPPDKLCRCHINFISSNHYFPDGYVVRMTGHSAKMPTEMAANFASAAYANVRKCSDIAKYWGHFFCIKVRIGEKGWAFGPDSGAPILDLNLTVIGFGSFAFRVKDDVPSKGTLLAYVTNVSHAPYRIWLMKEVYKKTISDNETFTYDTQRTRLSDCSQWSYYKWEDTVNYNTWKDRPLW